MSQENRTPSLIYQRFEEWRKIQNSRENHLKETNVDLSSLKVTKEVCSNINSSYPNQFDKARNFNPTGEKLLYVDILNYSEAFFKPYSRWNLKKSLEKVKQFVAAARKSNYKLKLFIDDSISTNEAVKKWRKRREREIIKGEKRVPQGTSVLLGDMFQRCGVSVLYSLKSDNDDTLACHAHADGADILSSDGDFFRYEGAAYTVWADFDHDKLRAGIFKLIPHTYEKVSKSQKISKRILTEPPIARKTYTNVNDFKNTIKNKDYIYISGVPSPLVRALGVNPHITIAPLRHALFSSIFDQGTVIKEEFPNWNATKSNFEWYINEITVSTEHNDYVELLENPRKAFLALFPNEAQNIKPQTLRCTANDWTNHRFACCCIVSTVCCIFKGKELLGTMMNMID